MHGPTLNGIALIHEADNHRARRVRYPRQVFGLVGVRCALLLAVASQVAGGGPVHVTAVVPTYRCGSAPDSHRIPSFDAYRRKCGTRTCCEAECSGAAADFVVVERAWV